MKTINYVKLLISRLSMRKTKNTKETEYERGYHDGYSDGYEDGMDDKSIVEKRDGSDRK